VLPIVTTNINKLTHIKKKNVIFGECLDNFIDVIDIIKNVIYFIAVNMKNGVEVNNWLISKPPFEIMIFVDIESIKFKAK
jgi:hypothetical protein